MFERAQRVLEKVGAKQACLFTREENMAYLSGYTGEGAVLIAQDYYAIITDFRYVEQAGQQAPGFEVLETSRECGQNAWIAKVLASHGIKSLCCETDHLSHDAFSALEKALDGVELVSCPVNLQQIRAVKSEEEIAFIRKAAQITDDAFAYLLTKVKPGMTELNLVALLYQYFLDHGAQGFSFSPIVASGENSSLPHAIAGNRVIRQGDLITFDIGCKVGGYCSDFTRTIAVGQVDPELEKIYGIVLEANLRGLKAVRPGVTGKEVDAACRDYIAENGYGPQFGHSTGHGVGLEIHELPRLSVISEQVLEPGMIVTVEPGIYLPGKGGVRIEDLVLVTKDGCEVLSHAGKEFLVLG